MAATLDRERILELARRAGAIPALPQSLSKVERELSRTTASAAKVAEVVQEDPALCLAILRVANSALHSPRNEITSIVQAVAQIGLNEVRRIVLVASLMGTWQRHSKQNLQRFWLHSVAVGITSAELARTVRIPLVLEEAAFAAGLLHDLGALVLYTACPEAAADIQEQAEARGCSAVDAEQEQWSIDHGELAGNLAERWKLPIALREVMFFHHRPWQANDLARPLVQIVHVADFFCNNEGYSRGLVPLPVWFDEGAWQALGLELSNVQSIVERVGRQCQSSQVWVTSVQTASL